MTNNHPAGERENSRPPRHIAIILDGNGRWAKKRGLPRTAGHAVGAETFRKIATYCKNIGVEYLTVYAFSTENWRRPQDEVSGLMKLLGVFLSRERARLVRDRVRFRVIGRRSDLSPGLQRRIAALEAETAAFTRQLVVALSYGGRAEIVEAAIRFADSPEKTEEAFARCLYAPDLPDPDLVVRTSGELRLSNFLLWQVAYSEFYVTDVLWPDFGRADFDAALAAYARRDRRHGGHA